MPLKIQSPVAASFAAFLAFGLVATTGIAQPGGGFGLDSRAESRTYHFADTDEDLPYCVYVSSKVKPDQPAPLIIALHGMGATPDIMCNSTTIDLAEEGGYIVAAPMGYNTTGWFGSPVISMGGGRGRGAAPDEVVAHPAQQAPVRRVRAPAQRPRVAVLQALAVAVPAVSAGAATRPRISMNSARRMS
jgi:hypothetical protein